MKYNEFNTLESQLSFNYNEYYISVNAMFFKVSHFQRSYFLTAVKLQLDVPTNSESIENKQKQLNACSRKSEEARFAGQK